MKITLRDFAIGGGAPLVLFAGPCVVESRDLVFRVAEQVKTSSQRHKIPAVFKSSYKKANRTSAKGFVGIGIDEALGFLAEVKKEFDLPIMTDIHTEVEASVAAQVADVLQIPAFLCRQTELLQAAGKTGRIVNIKKGQFAAPEDMKFAAEKVAESGNSNVLLTERGTTFGYHDLVVDMRSLKIMSELGYPVILDATHAVQRPSGNAQKGESAGNPEFIFPIARAGVAAGCDGLFVEVHPDPAQALSDSASQLNLGLLDELLRQVNSIDHLVREF